MRRIYTVLIYLLIPYILLRLFWKSYKLPAYRFRIDERFALNECKKADIWLHAVSLGEAIAATPLIERLIATNNKILVTTMTPSGSQHIVKYFANRVMHQYLPYDFPFVLHNFFKRVQPKLGIIMETELWPNLLHTAKQFNIELFLVNARISDAAFKQYKKVAFFFKPLLNNFTAILAQSHKDANRFIELGADKLIVNDIGNIKFDVNLTIAERAEIRELKTSWGEKRIVVIAASTHDGEEKYWLDHLHVLKDKIPGILLILVPRHPERFQLVSQLCNKMGFNTSLRSQPQTITEGTDIIVVDTLGELMHFYKLSDYAFVGGSLVPIGGHNVLEPISCGIPVLCGPHMNNSSAICETLKAANAVFIGTNITEILEHLLLLNTNKNLRQKQIDNATNILTNNRGVVNRYLEKITASLAF